MNKFIIEIIYELLALAAFLLAFFNEHDVLYMTSPKFFQRSRDDVNRKLLIPLPPPPPTTTPLWAKFNIEYYNILWILKSCYTVQCFHATKNLSHNGVDIPVPVSLQDNLHEPLLPYHACHDLFTVYNVCSRP